MHAQQAKRNSRTLMIARDDKDFNSSIRNFFERPYGHIHECGWNFASEEQITPMNDGVNSSLSCRFERKVIVFEKVLPAPASLDARSKGKIKPQMTIS